MIRKARRAGNAARAIERRRVAEIGNAIADELERRRLADKKSLFRTQLRLVELEERLERLERAPRRRRVTPADDRQLRLAVLVIGEQA